MRRGTFLALAWALAGCRGEEKPAAPTPPTPPPAPRPAPRPTPPLPPEQPVPATLTVIPIALEGARMAWSSHVRTSAHGAVAFGKIDDVGHVGVVLVPGAAPTIGRYEGEILRAVPGFEWGAVGGLGELTVGPVDVRGAFTARTVIETPGYTDVLAFGGTLTDGVVVFRVGLDRLGFAHSSGGAFTLAGDPVRVAASGGAVDVDGRSAYAWITHDDEMAGAMLTGGGPPTVVKLGARARSALDLDGCLTANEAWFGDDAGFVRFGEKTQAYILPGYTLQGCNATHALFHSVAERTYQVCAETCRKVALPTRSAAPEAAGLIGDEVVAVEVREGALQIVRERGEPSSHPLQGSFSGKLAHSNGKVLDIAGVLDDASVVVRVPLR